MLICLPYVTKLVSSGLIHLVNINYLSAMKGGKLSFPFKRLPNLLNRSQKLLRLHAWKSPSLSKTNPGQKSTRQTDLTKNANGGRVGGKRSLFPLPSGEKDPRAAYKRKPCLPKLPAIYVNTNPKGYRRKPPSRRAVTFATTGTPQPKASQGKGQEA